MHLGLFVCLFVYVTKTIAPIDLIFLTMARSSSKMTQIGT